MYTLLAQTSDLGAPVGMESYEADPVVGAFGGGIGLLITVLLIISAWKVFVKAGKPGWASLIPIYNVYIMMQIAGKPGWHMFLLLIPLVNIFVIFSMNIALAKAFGKSTAFGILGLTLFPFVGLPILAFGNSQYTSSAALPQPLPQISHAPSPVATPAVPTEPPPSPPVTPTTN